MMSHIGYLAWNCGSAYSDARTGGRPPWTEMYFWFSSLRRHRMASNASARCRVVRATARFSPPMVALAGRPGSTAGYGAKPNTRRLA
ncbi:Uncharacterised protein [Mycobacterium tuberculosis]|nr:Uncharacterised protein [Mycobacterium tuberculosis]